MSEKKILLGRILGPHGLKGEVKIKSFTEEPLDVASYGLVIVADGRRFRLTNARMRGDIVVASVKGVSDRNLSETLRGLELYVDRDEMPETEEGEFYQADLIGLPVVDEAGRAVGEVLGFQHFGAGELIEIKRNDQRTGLVPFADSMVPVVERDRVVLSAGGLAVLAANDETRAGAI